MDKVFTDKVSGKDVHRPQLQALPEFAREGDTVVHSLDRLARNLDDLRGLVTALTRRGVWVEFVKESLTFTGEDSAMSKLLPSVRGAFAGFERQRLKERQREGIEAAKRKGVYKGRKKALTPAQVKQLRVRVQAGEKKAALARELGIKPGDALLLPLRAPPEVETYGRRSVSHLPCPPPAAVTPM